MTAEEYFYNHWQKANRSRFGGYGDYDSDEYAIAFANDYAALRIHDFVGQSEQLKCPKCGSNDIKEGLLKLMKCNNCKHRWAF